MNLQQLQYFTTAAKLQNLSKAASILHVSQPMLSKQIARLEEEFGTPFFDRNGRKISINRAGVRFLECTAKVLQEVEALKEDLRILSAGSDRRIRVGAAGMPELILTRMAAFSAFHPDAEFECSQGPDFLENADINDYDMMIFPDEIKYEKLRSYPLYEEKYYLAVPASDASRKRNVFSLSMLEKERMVFLRGKNSPPEYPFQVMSALAVTPEGISFADTREMHHSMIASGMAAGFVPREEAGLYRQDRQIRLIPVPDQRFSRSMKICFRKEKYLTGMALQFRDYLMEELCLQ